MSNLTPTLPAGARVRDRLTGREYTATGTTARQGDQPDYWTIVHSPDGLDRQLPTDELDPVQDGDDSPAVDPDDVLRAAVSGRQFFPGLLRAAPLPVLVSVLVQVKTAAL